MSTSQTNPETPLSNKSPKRNTQKQLRSETNLQLKEAENSIRSQPTGRLLNHHPSIDFNDKNATPIPSFPRISSIQNLKALQRKSELHFLNHIAPNLPTPNTNISPNKRVPNSASAFFAAPNESSGTTTLRLVDQVSRDPSYPNLPYPDPDLSINVLQEQAHLKGRRISALPTRATPGIGSSNHNQQQQQSNEVYIFGQVETTIDPTPTRPISSKEPIESQIKSPTSNQSPTRNLYPSLQFVTIAENIDETQPMPSSPNDSNPDSKSYASPEAGISAATVTEPQPTSLITNDSPTQKQYASSAAAISATVTETQPMSPEPNDSPTRKQYASPAAAISATIAPAPLPATGSTIEQMWKEMQSRANSAPGIGKSLEPDSIFNTIDGNDLVADENRDRFNDTHLKTFSKFDSITNHYAAKRKVLGNNTLDTDSKTKSPLETSNEQNKRQKTSDFGYSKTRVVVANEEEEKKKKVANKRQLEIVKARRKSQVTESKKFGSSGIKGIGTRMRSAIKTVKGALTNSITSSPLKPKPSIQNGVGFGVPSGLGIGPANVPTLTKKVIPTSRSINLTTNKNNRLLPAGPSEVLSNRHKPTASFRSVSNSATYGTIKKRVMSNHSLIVEPSNTLHRKGGMNNAGIDSMKMKKVETKKVDPIITRSNGLSVTYNPVASTSKTSVIGNKRSPATTQLINGKNKQVIVGSSKTELVSQPIASSSSNKTLVTKSSDTTAPLKLKSPTKRAHAFGSATQPRKVLPQPTKPTWQPKTIVRNSKILPNNNKPSIIPQPISRYTASTRIGIGKTNTIRSVIRSTNATNLPKACKNNRILNEGSSGPQVIVKDTGKRGLDEDVDEDEDELPPRSQKKIKVS